MSNKGKAGSIIDIRLSVGNTTINSYIASLDESWKGCTIEWLSPVESRDYKEYADKTFWDGRLDVNDDSFWQYFQRPREFWPNGGPNWDGLAILHKVDGGHTLVLFEAKAHKGEINSTCKATEPARSEIMANITEAQTVISKTHKLTNADWLLRHYQYANRLAYVTKLRKEGVDAVCIYLYYANDPYWNLSDKTDVNDWNRVILTEKQYFFSDKDNCTKDLGIYELVIDLANEENQILNQAIVDKLLENMK